MCGTHLGTLLQTIWQVRCRAAETLELLLDVTQVDCASPRLSTSILGSLDTVTAEARESGPSLQGKEEEPTEAAARRVVSAFMHDLAAALHVAKYDRVEHVREAAKHAFASLERSQRLPS